VNSLAVLNSYNKVQPTTTSSAPSGPARGASNSVRGGRGGAVGSGSGPSTGVPTGERKPGDRMHPSERGRGRGRGGGPTTGGRGGSVTGGVAASSGGDSYASKAIAENDELAKSTLGSSNNVSGTQPGAVKSGAGGKPVYAKSTYPPRHHTAWDEK